MNDLMGTVRPNPFESASRDPRGRDEDDVRIATTSSSTERAIDRDTAGSSGDDDGASELMRVFFDDVRAVKQNLKAIRNALIELDADREESKRSATAEEASERQERMNATIERVNKVAREAKLRLENLDEDNARAVKSGKIAPSSSEERTRAALASSLKTKLKEQLGEFQNVREQLRVEYKEIVERRYYAVTGSVAPEEEIDRLIETGESETMFQTALLERGRGQILDTVNEIQDRHYAIRELERKLLELNQIFLDMSVLVEAQGEMINSIESHVAKSVVYVQQGHVELKKAREYQKSTRKWACCVMIILLIVLISILLPVLKPWKSGSA
jgi:syntaxin 1B/2/3